MKIEEIKELIQALEQSTLTSLEVSQGNDSVRLEKNYTAAPAAGTVAPSISTPILAETAAEPTVPTEESAAPQPTGIAVTCPLVGVFYAAAAPEDMPFIRQRFYRGANADGQPGAGLGLFIAEHLVERMAGELSVEAVEPGLRVTLSLPLG